MLAADRYVLLMASLPPHPRDLFDARRLPISRERLEERLRLLEPEDARILALIEHAVHWDRIDPNASSQAVIAEYRRMLEVLPDGFLKELVHWRAELRTVVAALRLRQQGLPPPSAPWGMGRFASWIAAHWHSPAFALEHVYPWLPRAAEYMQQRKPLALERLLLSLVWEHYGRMGHGHYFDFRAVVIYVLRWSAVERWVRYQEARALQRFKHLIEEGLRDWRLAI
ncbi:MAG: DUF2764 family protein [Methylohalobius sp.]|nr:DUF2764 family protein [Methylohalobius sp.]